MIGLDVSYSLALGVLLSGRRFYMLWLTGNWIKVL